MTLYLRLAAAHVRHVAVDAVGARSLLPDRFRRFRLAHVHWWHWRRHWRWVFNIIRLLVTFQLGHADGSVLQQGVVRPDSGRRAAGVYGRWSWLSRDGVRGCCSHNHVQGFNDRSWRRSLRQLDLIGLRRGKRRVIRDKRSHFSDETQHGLYEYLVAQQANFQTGTKPFERKQAVGGGDFVQALNDTFG